MSPVRFPCSPYSEDAWQQIDALAQAVEAQLQALGVGLMMGGEPTFVSREDFESSQWRIAALGPEKYQLAAKLLQRLEQRFSLGGTLLHDGIGKLYPGEDFPRWSLGCYWRDDGISIWHNPALRAEDGKDYGHDRATAAQFIQTLVGHLGISEVGILPTQDSLTSEWAGYAMPLLAVHVNDQVRWSTCRWLLADGRKSLQLLRGNSQIGLRLPLHAIARAETLTQEAVVPLEAAPIVTTGNPVESPPNSICVALGVEVRGGTLRVFLPPLSSTRSFVDLVAAVEATADETGIPVLIEGYPPPGNGGISGFQITPDPGVIEVNIHPANTWNELVEQTTILYEEAEKCGLGTEKYSLEGQRISTGGGAHITIGGKTKSGSPLLRRPDLLCSLIRYWQNHPSLSYLFAGLFVGPTSQSPRLDEARHETLYELEIAFQTLQSEAAIAPEVLDCLLSKLLVDCTGNAHRTILCIDKLYPVRNSRLQLGLLEFRGFSMPTQVSLRLLQLLLVRSLVAWFWQQSYTETLIRWGTVLHDRFLLPYYLRQDLQDAIAELRQAGYNFELPWFDPFFEFRFPLYGSVSLNDEQGNPLQLELRHAIEPWHVIGDEANNGGAARMVDASMERLQVLLRGASSRHPCTLAVLCNGYEIPLVATDVPGEWIGSVRFRARQVAPICHPALAPHSPLVFEVVDRKSARWPVGAGLRPSRGGCTYYANAPQEENYSSFPTNPAEAATRMAERFIPHGPKETKIAYQTPAISPEYPSTLDLRRSIEPSMHW